MKWIELLYQETEGGKFYMSLLEEFTPYTYAIEEGWMSLVSDEQDQYGYLRVDQILAKFEAHEDIVKYTLGYFGGSGTTKVSLNKEKE